MDEVIPPSRASAWVRTRYGRLALSLLVVELIAGMQSFMYATIGPEIAREFQAERYMGLIYSGILASSFLTLPWGPKALHQFGVSRLMLAMTSLSAFGSIVSATAPALPFFLLGQVLTGLSVGILATASMSAVVQHLPTRWRQVVLATFSATYIISSILGPVYAASLAHFFGWRWAMLVYIPFLLTARFIISKNTSQGVRSGGRAKTPNFLVSLTMPVSAFLISIGGNFSIPVGLALVGAGVVAISVCAVHLLPYGVFRLFSGRPRAVRIFFVVTGIYFAMDAVIPISLRSVLGASIGEVGVILSAGGFAWAVVGFACGKFPADRLRQYRLRGMLGTSLLAIGFSGVACILLIRPVYGIAALGVCWTIASIGMGLVYLDTMNIIFTEPDGGDSMSELDAISSVAYSEQMAAVLFATPFATAAGFLVAQGIGFQLGYLLWILVVFACALIFWVPVAARALKRGGKA